MKYSELISKETLDGLESLQTLSHDNVLKVIRFEMKCGQPSTESYQSLSHVKLFKVFKTFRRKCLHR